MNDICLKFSTLEPCFADLAASPELVQLKTSTPTAPDQQQARIIDQHPSLCPRLLYQAPLNRPGQARLSPPNFRLQRLNQQQHFGGFFVVQPRILGEGAVAAAGGDRLEG